MLFLENLSFGLWLRLFCPLIFKPYNRTLIQLQICLMKRPAKFFSCSQKCFFCDKAHSPGGEPCVVSLIELSKVKSFPSERVQKATLKQHPEQFSRVSESQSKALNRIPEQRSTLALSHRYKAA